MPEQKSRKCSLCKEPGHTKKTCAKYGDFLVSGEEFSTKKNKKAPVYINVMNRKASSPYVIELEKKQEKKEKDIWSDVPVYNEKNIVKKVKTQTMDWAEMVKMANRDMMIKTGVASVNKKIKEEQKLAKIKSEKEEIKPAPVKESLIKKEEVRKEKKMALSFDFEKIKGLFRFKKFAYVSALVLLAVVSFFPASGYIQKLKAAEEQAVEQGTIAFLSLQASTVAVFESDLEGAEAELFSALQAFSQANSIVEDDYKILLSVAKMLPVIGTKVSSRQNLLLAGNHLALGNTYLIKGVEEAQENLEMDLTDRFFILQNHLKSASVQYKEALDYLNKVDLDSIPLDYQKTFSEFKVLFAMFINDMDDLVDLSRTFNTIFGGDSFRRYLLVFQNEHELRPTGGFMGSFAVLDVQKGKILKIDLPGGGTYDLRGQFTEFVKPPLPLQLLNKRWEFQDANWFPDFAVSAKKMGWFYENGRGTTVDGVIAINSSVLERVLKVLGPLEADEVVFEEDSAIETLQYEVEEGYDEETEQPKEILAVMLNSLLENLSSVEPKSIMKLLVEAHDALVEKEIQIYIDDERTQDSLRKFGWTGEISPIGPAQDYLNIINTNIQGQKSDAKIEQKITHEVVIDEFENIVDTVIVERKHGGEPGEMFYGSANVDYVRVYVPEGSELIEADGFTFPPEDAFRVPESWYGDDADLAEYEKEAGIHLTSGTRITNEFGKTVFGNWVITPPGQTSVFYFKYKLPFKAPVNESPESNMEKWQSVFVPSINKKTSRYSLLVQKQSGSDSEFQTTIIYPTEWVPAWKSNEDIDLASNGAMYSAVLDTDKVIGIAVESEIDNE
ncbi:MAG: hypothetical protein A2469_03865 [Candidatus Magasanikbacteria bacterium RIFOXYC2_FULL_40_16]|uniref:DUF4012 domain-containing protein n=3 Tax=Candidatus Magasanikiibacteriota TaxID=1752731 RepID=A0A1F6NEW7_9BACT|nr:MAG: hypothetical protein A2224_03165 [Candidatus Magasanikbacteria bacterium RIFOXYA2_FULL_40_20]OGH82395.1 MAG: hypothetical protein A2373_03130 [Candidatus Magasanikbacteria bacterium RIFOXYB1_FULL_40_15]OGH85130.1 MAG: hypothetical protein A2301_01850 [Candidatus Magasanikbacteria bacterium RIFOXYB2_FULL_40_13]OGH87874.1 MAG: hypothetical protein A2206_00185 [Candidatus Magasanikbacteria bacterium RIFOXYA1_FULL_40_8]OGH89375.1 MAG: hypothetical protein A2469_03865 [Candidatus Magasanikba